jgi:excisionase family DNA binding protein
MDKSDAQEGSALLRVEVAARTLQIGRSKAYQLIATGELPSVRIGAAVRVPREALDAWIAARTRGGQAA